jgi:hypothetical protein
MRLSRGRSLTQLNGAGFRDDAPQQEAGFKLGEMCCYGIS